MNSPTPEAMKAARETLSSMRVDASIIDKKSIRLLLTADCNVRAIAIAIDKAVEGERERAVQAVEACKHNLEADHPYRRKDENHADTLDAVDNHLDAAISAIRSRKLQEDDR